MSLNKLPNLKSAILNLPEKERDKLLVRLINKDKILIQQLHYQLLEDGFDLEERRENVLKKMNAGFEHISNQMQYHPYNARFLMKNLRSISGYVNEHLLITKDKLGEIELRLYILSKAFHDFPHLFEEIQQGNEKMLAYVAGRIKNIVGNYIKLHEDIRFDYREKLNDVLKFAHSTVLKFYLVDKEIPKEV